MNKTVLAIKLLKSRPVRRLAVRAFKSERVRRVVAKQVAQRLLK